MICLEFQQWSGARTGGTRSPDHCGSPLMSQSMCRLLWTVGPLAALLTEGHLASCSVPCPSPNVPPSQSPAGLHSHCPSPNRDGAWLPPLPMSASNNVTHGSLYVIVKRSSRTDCLVWAEPKWACRNDTVGGTEEPVAGCWWNAASRVCASTF